jgi:hypothetical protein
VRMFKTARFARFARADGIADDFLVEAVRRAELGLVNAWLGGGVIKQRLAREGQGRSGGYRAIAFFRADERAVFAFGYAKSDRDDLHPGEVVQFKRLAKHVLALADEQLSALVARGALEEVVIDDPGIPE